MISGKDIILFSSIDWDFNWQIQQELSLFLARNNNRVLYIENTGLRSPILSDFPRFKKRFYDRWKSFKGFKEIKENIYTFSPIILPFPHSKIANFVNKFIIARTIKKWFSAMNFNADVLWVFLPSRLSLDLIKILYPKLVVYYCIEDFSKLSNNTKKTIQNEQELFKSSDVVFIKSETLLKKCSSHNNVSVVEIGVAIRDFDVNISPIPDLKLLKKPIIGFVGGINKNTDLSLIKYVASNCEGTLVMVGPIQTDTSFIERIENIKFFGPQPHSKLASFMKYFDVGIIPYKINEYSKTVNPAKMNEYLAMGLPVVSTALPEVIIFNKKYNVLEIANNKDEFVDAMKKVIVNNSEEKKTQRIKIAKENDWDHKISNMLETVQIALKNKKTPDVWERLMNSYKRDKYKFTVPMISFLFIFLLIFYTPFMWKLAEPLKLNDSLETADALIVFGGGFGENVNSDESFQEKLKYTLDLYKQGLASKIVFASNYKYYFGEAETMKLLAESEGILKENLIVEEKGKNTYENIQAMKVLAEKNNWKKVILVSSPYHLRRAVMVWKKSVPNIEVLASPAKTRYYQRLNYGIEWYQIKGIMYEYAALVYYWWKGYI